MFVLFYVLLEAPTIHRFTSYENLGSLGAKFDDVNVRRIKIAAETTCERQARKLVAKEARHKLEANSLEKGLKMLPNLEYIVVYLQTSEYKLSKKDAEILAESLEKLRRRQEEKVMPVLSKTRHGPRIGLFRMFGNGDPIETKILTSLQADMQDVYVLLLCEELVIMLSRICLSCVLLGPKFLHLKETKISTRRQSATTLLSLRNLPRQQDAQSLHTAATKTRDQTSRSRDSTWFLSRSWTSSVNFSITGA